MKLTLDKEHKKVLEWLATRPQYEKSSFTLTEIAVGVGISDEDRLFKILKELHEHPDLRVFKRETLIFSMGYSSGEPKFVISDDAQRSWQDYQKAEKTARICPECDTPSLQHKLWCPNCKIMFDL
jgi:hypothetical protein